MNKMAGYPKVYCTYVQNLQFERINSKSLTNKNLEEILYKKFSTQKTNKARVMIFSCPSSQKLIDQHKELKDLIIKQKYEQIMIPADYMATSFGAYNYKHFSENLVMDITSQDEKRQNLMGNTTFLQLQNIWNKRPITYYQVEYEQINTFQASCLQFDQEHFLVVVKNTADKTIIGKVKLSSMEPVWFMPLLVSFDEPAASAIVHLGKYAVVQVADAFAKHSNFFKIDVATK